ncbi:hypothetical protein ESY86_15620 [Subsaximicrobium wynnwilliamsii]|uniref:Peptidase S74 domain-containing protein n=1 Tax=Subsaximicrobium wynnwilliamsii TaxID=291179 RepID=A0A5C6ZCI0_9FLAO|nr:tail fiber domain-containing protein [Subsaximicrobium wynnwilliamsii]TXD82096.1 hypothetical protein ESY87_15210 [Subsaximicrobium wynnwilliamsii]TXD87741.1 hypothetical protein ESY86_15620 [Subsaximicrobium wynnwilliamsii]TXE01552.1 hypothetical protein ESY88_15200 [Subsaximicrobium wynnwilliamsii]
MKIRHLILLALLPLFSVNAQNFEDNFANESINDVPTQWRNVKGLGRIGELDGQKVLNLDRYTVVSPIVNGQDNNYLGDQFTIEFDAFFYDASSPNRQYYIIHLWEGTGVYGENGKHTDPYLIYKHGITVTGSFVNRKKLEPLAELERKWRHIKIEFAQKTLKIYINSRLTHIQPDLFYDPPMVSFSARNASGATSGITNVTITDQVDSIGPTTDEEPDDNSTSDQNLPYTFPPNDGNANQILQTDGQGTLSWVDFLADSSAGDSSTGLEAIDQGNGIGWRLVNGNEEYYGNIGKNAIDLSIESRSNRKNNEKGAMGEHAFASGNSTTASGRFSTAMGQNTIASGTNSMTMNSNTTASGLSSTAMGNSTWASGTNSIVAGNNTRAFGDNSVAMGGGVIADANNSFAIGRYNIGGGHPKEWREIDPIFEIGNGKSYPDKGTKEKSNALTVLKNGNIGIGTHTPQVKLHIQDGLDANNSKGGYLIIGDKQKENIVFDNNEIIARNNVQPAILYLQSDGGDVYVGRAVVHSSDRRLKQDIENLNYGLNEILQLRPVSYHWKSNPDATNKSLGLIAQDVQPILKELITANTNNGNDTLGVNYTELIPILIKAIQEQQTVIENLKSSATHKDEALVQLNERIEKLETLYSTHKISQK